MGDMVSFPRPDAEEVPAYYAPPPANKLEKAPGLVVVQEWWGLNPQIKKTADRFASAGFRTMVPDLYRGKVARDGAEGEHLMGELDWKSAQQDILGAVLH